MMNNFFGAICLILLTFGVCFAQVKSFENAAEEVKNFSNFESFSLSYDESKYLTKAEISVDVLGDKDDLRKQFSKFEWQLTSLFAIKGIDAKPVRNTLCVNSQSKIFAFSRENALTIKFSDGDEVDFGDPNRASELKRGKANEKLCWDVAKEIFRDFAKSEKVEFQIGAIKSQIRSDKMQIFKDYANLIGD